MMYDRAAGTTVGLTRTGIGRADGLTWERDSRSPDRLHRRCGTLRYIASGSTARSRYRLTKGRRSSRWRCRHNGKALVAIRQSFIEPPTLVRLDARSGAADQAQPISTTRRWRNSNSARYESVTYKGAEGRRHPDVGVLSTRFDATKKYPALMLLHGGPHNAIVDAVQWRWNAQVFASWGYVVTWHNFHGSSGFGKTSPIRSTPTASRCPTRTPSRPPTG
jgi:dipeptidyl aminopeptidase/acylaminoacyl peptidase